MPELVISARDLCKSYQIYGSPGHRLGQIVAERLDRILGRPPRKLYREFRALYGVSFDVGRGEAVGIVGRNGSGKSTLLQIICGTLAQTSGSLQTAGRIAALLELGSGFNPEFTGRENVFLNAAVLGMSAQQTRERFDGIAAFADIGDYIEQPIKTYSSGMVMRLAFAVAVSIDPEILVIDEALSVGDELFQRKCLGRIETIRDSGATVLFVSHSGASIMELCERALLLDHGELLADGPPKQVLGNYQRLLYAPESERERLRQELRRLRAEPQDAGDALGVMQSAEPGEAPAAPVCVADEEFYDPSLEPSSTLYYHSHGAVIDSPTVTTIAGTPANLLRRGQRYCYRYRVRFEQEARGVRFGMMMKTLNGVELGGAASAPSAAAGIDFVPAGSCVNVCFEFDLRLAPGVYFVNAGVNGVVDGAETFLHRVLDAAMFRVLPGEPTLATGTVDFACTATVEAVHA